MYPVTHYNPGLAVLRFCVVVGASIGSMLGFAFYNPTAGISIGLGLGVLLASLYNAWSLRGQ